MCGALALQLTLNDGSSGERESVVLKKLEPALLLSNVELSLV
jgi:hypothetical protein